MIVNLLGAVVIVILYMLGGQINKAIRRYGVPTIVIGLAAMKDHNRKWYKKIPYLVLIGVLSMGYGVNSRLMGVFKKDWIVRIVYGTILAIPLGVITLLHNATWKAPIIALVLAAAYSIRLPYSFRVGKYDFLWEDLVRGSALAAMVIFTL